MSENSDKVVEGFRFMPPSLGAWIGRDIPAEPFSGHIPWTPLQKPVSETTFALMTSAGISMKTDPPFDVHIERLSDLRPYRVGLVSRDSHRGEDANDRDDDHQLDKCKPLTFVKHPASPHSRHFGDSTPAFKKKPRTGRGFSTSCLSSKAQPKS